MESGGESLSRLEALPEGIMQLVTKNIIDYKGWFALATINTRFKNLMYDPSRLLVEAAAHVGGKFGILGVPENEQAGMHFYELAAAHGNVEAMLMCGESLRRAEDDAGTGAGAERLFRAALAREGDVHDERHFLLMRPSVNAFRVRAIGSRRWFVRGARRAKCVSRRRVSSGASSRSGHLDQNASPRPTSTQ